MNRYNAPELVSTLFKALEVAGLGDTVEKLKQMGVPRLVNDAWRNRVATELERQWGNPIAAYMPSGQIKILTGMQQELGSLFRHLDSKLDDLLNNLQGGIDKQNAPRIMSRIEYIEKLLSTLQERVATPSPIQNTGTSLTGLLWLLYEKASQQKAQR